MPDTQRQLHEIVAQVFGADASSLRPDAPWMELGVDSFDLVEFVIAVQEQFRVDLGRADLTSLRTVQDIASYIETQLHRT